MKYRIKKTHSDQGVYYYPQRLVKTIFGRLKWKNIIRQYSVHDAVYTKEKNAINFIEEVKERDKDAKKPDEIIEAGNSCIKCGKPIGNVTFTICDECMESEYR